MGSYGLEVPYQPMPLFEFRYSQNPLRTQTYRNFNSQNQQGFGRSIGGSNQQNQQFTQQFNNQNQQFNQRNQQFNQQTFNTAFGNFASNGITEEQRQLYLPVMRALLKVMQTDRPSARDINTLMVETRDLNKKVPKGQNLLGNFANFGIDGLESMGLPEFGDINNQNQQFNQERSFNNQNQRFNNQNQRFNNQRNQQFNNQRNQQFRDYN